MLNTLYDAYRVLFKVYSEGAFIKQALNDTDIEESNRSHTTKLCYGVLDKDIELSYYISALCGKNPKQAIRIILKESFYEIKYLKTAPYAVVDAAVELIKKMGKGGNAGFVNAVLRKFSTVEIPLPREEYKRLSVRYSYPEWLVKTLVADYGASRVERIMSADQERTCVRFNDGIDGEKYLADRNRAYEKTPFPNAFFVNGFKRDADYDKGVYTFQSVGSVAICAAVGSGETLFDACSAPGGKAVNLASSFTEVIAADIHEHRVNLIESYAKRMGKNNVTAVRLDSGVYREEYDAKFDKVLVDAPCSGTGVLKDNPDIKLNRKAEDVRSLSEIQHVVLSNCARYVRTGGNLIYSTCSVLKSENQGIIDKFLSENDEFTEEPIDSPLAHERIGRGINFFPDESFGAGFFVCRMKRVK